MDLDRIDQLFAKLALKNGFVSEDVLRACMRELRTGRVSGGLGRMLLERGYVSGKQYRAIARYIEQKTGVSLDEIAMEVRGDGPAPAAARSASSARVAPPGAGAPAGGHAQVPPLAELLALAKSMGASDLHLSIGVPPFVRQHGELVFLQQYRRVDAETARERLLAVLSPEQARQLEEHLDIDTAIELQGVGRFRSSIFKQRKGYAGVFRVIQDRVPTIEELGLPEAVRKFTTYHQGIVLVTGAAGSGKSSTLAALIEVINRTRKDHIITLEDPIEFVFEPKLANITQRQVELHTQSWANALRAALREDPDVIMVGEMRDLDTMRLAVTAAETGHLVLATLHTTSAARTIDRLLDVFPPKEQAQIRAMVSESLRGVISQQLVPRRDGQGRVLAVELLFSTPAVANLIRERQTFKLHSVMQTGRRLGMQLMDDALADLVARGLITEEQARFRAVQPRRFGGTGGLGLEPEGGEQRRSRVQPGVRRRLR
ncbi:MAG: hypothetical protein KatS3mg102_0148 [Planctomycetota bacterium]|nr:MAG: hypothetical protein KatS3mg102_0148 [Planctomycetota bacterium]